MSSYIEADGGFGGVEQYPTFGDFPVSGETNILYVDVAENVYYTWNGSSYVELSSGLALIQDTRANIFALTDVENGQQAYATDTQEFFLYQDAWLQLDTILTERTGAIDAGAIQNSSPTGYSRDYIDRKHIANSTIGGNIETKEGGIRTINSQSLGRRIAQYYLNGQWQTALTGVNIQTDNTESIPDIEFTDFTPWVLSLITGNSDVTDTNGIPIVQNMRTDTGALQTPLIIDGGNF